jgi:hypothetical protein
MAAMRATDRDADRLASSELRRRLIGKKACELC